MSIAMTRLKIALIIGNKPNFNEYALKYFLLSLNKFQSTYEFYFPYIKKFELAENEEDPIILITRLNELPKDTLNEFDYYIIIIQNKLVNDYFAYPENMGAVVTTHHWQEKYSPPSLFEYLLSSIYYCLIYSQKKPSGVLSNGNAPDLTFDIHNDTIGCYADAAYDRNDNRIDVAMGYICDSHKEKIKSFYGKDFLLETIDILEGKWIGNIDVKNSIAYNLKHYFNFNINRDSGFNKNFWENIKGKIYDVPGLLIFEVLKAIILALIAALLLWVGIGYK
jgi:hypothetical protein